MGLPDWDFTSNNLIALIFALISVYLASLGNIISARNQKNSLPVLQTNAFSMIYGSLLMFAIVLFLGKEFKFDFSFSYISSLLYLVVLGSIAAFGAYLTLIGRIGADRAANITLSVPMIAMVMSTIFEGYQWSTLSFAGALLVIGGNFISLRK